MNEHYMYGSTSFTPMTRNGSVVFKVDDNYMTVEDFVNVYGKIELDK